MRLPTFLKAYIPPDAVKQLAELVNQPSLIGGLREAAHRMGWKESWQPKDLQEAVRQARKWVESFAQKDARGDQPLQASINATGEIFGHAWASVPLDRRAIQSQVIASGSFVNPVNLREMLRTKLLVLSGAESAVVVHSLPVAIRLLARLPQLTDGWVVARADCLRMGEKTDLRDLLASRGDPVVEVGASNACLQQDFEKELKSHHQAVMTTVPSLLDVGSHNASEYRQHAIVAAKKHNALVVELLMHGHWYDLAAIDFSSSGHIPVVADRLRAGADIVVLPGNGLVGGPESAILVGKSKPLDALSNLAASGGDEISLPTAVTLWATLCATSDLSAWKQTPIGAMLSNGIDNLVHRATRLATQLEGSTMIHSVSVETSSFPIGRSHWNGIKLPSAVLRIEPKDMTAQEFGARLRSEPSSIVSCIDGQQLLLVMRTIDPDEDQEIVAAFRPPEQPAKP